MKSLASDRLSPGSLAAGILTTCLVFASVWMIFFVAPTEATMGDVQRIVYIHVPIAWCGLAGCVVMGVSSAMFLVRRQLIWDYRSQAAGEIGWLCSTLTLATGSAWAHEAWGTWWTWEPRLTLSLVLWMIYAGLFLVRSSIEDPDRRARIVGVLSIVGMSDVPMVLMATRWFRGVHPITPEMDPRMKLVLWISVVSFTALFISLGAVRRRQLETAEGIAQLEIADWSAPAVSST